MSNNEYRANDRELRPQSKHPVLANVIVITLMAIIGLVIVYISLAIFTKHGEEAVVPGVEKMSYTDAIDKLHKAGFKIEIRDSLYTDKVKPGFVIEQFPRAKSIVKPGRKIFLYIQAVHPKEVVIDDDNNPRLDAMRGVSLRSVLSRLEELGFKRVRVVRLLGSYDGVAKIIANGRVVKKMQKVPVTSQLTIQVYDGRLRELSDSLMNIEFGANHVSDGMVQGEGSQGIGGESYSSEPVVPEAEYRESPTQVEELPSEPESNPYLE